MKVLLINGSPHQNGCVHTALEEVAESLNRDGVQSEIFWIGNQPVQGCAACWKCREAGADGCIFKDPVYSALLEKVKSADGIVLGSPVYYAAPAGAFCALLDRLFFSAGKYLSGKVGACVVNCRRGGSSAAFDRLNKYFTILQMQVASSTYWNSTHGLTPDEVKQDAEGMQVMRMLGKNIAYILKAKEKAALPPVEPEEKVATNFIR